MVQRLGERFKLTVHQTACDGLRACEELCDGPEYQLSKEGEGEECRRKCAPCPALLRCPVMHTLSCLKRAGSGWVCSV